MGQRYGVVSALVWLVGCGGGGGGLTGQPDMTAAALTDKQVCDTACASMIACGVLYDAACSTNCQTITPVFLACAKATPLTDCNGLALCAFKQYQALYCAGGGGYPAGAASCWSTAMCEGTCNVVNPTVACICGCIAGLDPRKALNSLINAQCANARCPSCLPQSFNGAACNTCAATNCGTNPCVTS